MACAIEEESIEKVWIFQPKQDKSKKPLIFVRFQNEQSRDIVLKNARVIPKLKDAKYHAMFLNPDYTKTQQKEHFDLREELKKRRLDGETVTIRNFIIVPIRKAKGAAS